MATTVANTLTDIAKVFHDLDSTTALRYLNDVHKALIGEFKLYVTTATFSAFDGSAREYTWGEGYVSLWSADYYNASGATPIPLGMTSIEELDEVQPGWRTSTVVQPQFAYLTANSTGGALLGFDTIPPASTASYPQVVCQVGTYTALLSSDSLSATIETNDVYVAGVCAKWARLRVPELKDYWEQNFREEKQKLAMYVQRRQRHNEPRTVPYMGVGVASY